MKITSNLINNQNYIVWNWIEKIVRNQVYSWTNYDNHRDCGTFTIREIVEDVKHINKLKYIVWFFTLFVGVSLYLLETGWTVVESIIIWLLFLWTACSPFVLYSIDAKRFNIEKYNFYISRYFETKEWIIIYIKKSLKTK